MGKFLAALAATAAFSFVAGAATHTGEALADAALRLAVDRLQALEKRRRVRKRREKR